MPRMALGEGAGVIEMRRDLARVSGGERMKLDTAAIGLDVTSAAILSVNRGGKQTI